MKKKGFTLVELLAVIIILAVIALITTPIVLDAVDGAKKSAFENSTYGIIDAVRLKSMENMLDGSSMAATYTFPSEEIEIEGEQPKGGEATVDKQGRVAIAAYNEKWCAIKTKEDSTITLTEYVEGECVLPVEIVGDPIRKKIATLVLDGKGACKTDGTTYEYMGGCYIKAEDSETLANYIWYNGFLWRIMGINNLGTENESVKMITEENVTAISYGYDSSKFKLSNADSWLNEYFYNKLSDENNLKTNIIVSGPFCDEESTESSPSRTVCAADSTLSLNVGLISIDEYILAGEKSSYLKNNQYFWTITPGSANTLWDVTNSGGFVRTQGAFNPYGLRPVINVNVNSIVTGGEGTLSDFYVLGEYKNGTSTIKKLNSAKIGEYVNLNDKIYRVVENGEITKLILDNYYQEDGEYYKMKFGDDNTFTTNDKVTIEGDTEIGVGYKLNTDVLDWLTAGDNQEKLKSMIVNANWYQSIFKTRAENNSHKVTLDETGTAVQAQVGLIRIGEMLSGQSYSILPYFQEYWTMTPTTDEEYSWYISTFGDASDALFSTKHTLRPVINLNSNLDITSGNGTFGHEYIIKIAD